MPPCDESSSMGPIPAGIWRLNESRSRLLSTKAMTLWILQNDDQELAWVAVETNSERVTQVISWRGRYGGPPAKTAGAAAIEARLTSARHEGIRTEGEFPGMGSFVEVCTLSEGGRRMICKGEITTPTGVQHYLEDFDWVSESPHRP